MGKEIERKFLVKKDMWDSLKKPDGERYRQGYLVTAPGKTIRVRLTEKAAFLTIKGKSIGISRSEFEYEIPKTDAVELLNDFALSELSKVRYKINYAGKLWEVDVFSGKNEDLIVAEIELEHENEEFELPPWIDKEVTGIQQYYNSYLTIKPYQDWNS
jgi:adenylate cyclase